MKLAHLIPGIGPLASAGIGAAAGLLAPPEPEIPTAMDDWDREFEERTGSLPSFSRLVLRRLAQNKSAGIFNPQSPGSLIIRSVTVSDDGDALSFAGRRRA